MSRTANGNEFQVSRDELRKLTRHENEDVALGARVVYEVRYGEPP